ncbi:MAG: PAS domain S-box protein [Oxalicibacterium faecigallinarum]|uniref:PAS domain S-box protein n=1 Tax=Oxalicibacterium faecigallinarum TaxID=573741 RepID=UPI002807F0E8|nr:PAS domain S-box protein [Oxalicibacterium faecigallinarum]MDQ7968192.1 PAS domain S-box protein [Oxalicibacterium faecigallinarum]
MDKLFESAFNYSSIGMALVGLNGRWLKVNPSLCRLLGYTESELLHIDFQTLTYPEDLDTDMTHVGNLLKGEIDSYEMEKRYIHKSGTLIWALLSVSLVRDENGMPSFFISQIQDITARKEAVLQRDTFFNLSHDMLATSSAQGYLRQVNPAWTAVLGWSADELTGRPFLNFVHPDDIAITVRETDLSTNGQSTDGFCNRYRAKDGTYRWIEWSSSSIHNGVMYCSARDVTQRKMEQELLVAEQERLHVTLQSIGDGVITTDIDGIITSINPMGESIMGWSATEAIGKPIDQIMHLVDEKARGTVANPLIEALRQRSTIKRDLALLVRRNGRDCAITESASPIQRADGKLLGGVLVFQDVTEKRKSEAHIKYQATHDQLTLLLNRAEFERVALQLFQDARTNNNQHCILLLDLDAFKAVNDQGGHMAGDEMLKRISSLISTKLRVADSVARLGGDEFGVLLQNCPLHIAERIAGQLIEAISAYRLEWEGHTFKVGACIGLTRIFNESGSMKEIIAIADAACYRAKAAGKNQFKIG